jgi:hypothetical protein
MARSHQQQQIESTHYFLEGLFNEEEEKKKFIGRKRNLQMSSVVFSSKTIRRWRTIWCTAAVS